MEIRNYVMIGATVVTCIGLGLLKVNSLAGGIIAGSGFVTLLSAYFYPRSGHLKERLKAIPRPQESPPSSPRNIPPEEEDFEDIEIRGHVN